MDESEDLTVPPRRARRVLALAAVLLAIGFAVLDLLPPEAPGRALLPALHGDLIRIARLLIFLFANVALMHAVFVLVGSLRGVALLLAPAAVVAAGWAGLALREIFFSGLLGRLAITLQSVNPALVPIVHADGTLEPVYDALCAGAPAGPIAHALATWRFVAWFQLLFFSAGTLAALTLAVTRLLDGPIRLGPPRLATALCFLGALIGSAPPVASRILPLPFASTLASPWGFAVESYLKDDGLKGLFWTFGCGG